MLNGLPNIAESQDMSGGGCGAGVHTSPRSGVERTQPTAASPTRVGRALLTKKQAAAGYRPATPLSGARALAGPTAGLKQTDHVGGGEAEVVSERSDEQDRARGSRKPLVYRSSVRLLLLPVMAARRGQGERLQPMAIVRPAIRLPKEAEELGSLSAPATPAMGRATGEKSMGRKVPKSVASMVRR